MPGLGLDLEYYWRTWRVGIGITGLCIGIALAIFLFVWFYDRRSR